MLAQANKYLDRIKFPAIAQTKMDGMRANIIIRDGNVTVFSRNGKEMQTFGRFNDMVDLDNIMLDGEFLVHPKKGFELELNKGEFIKYDGKTPMDRKTGNGIINKSIVSDKRRTTITKDEAEMFKIVLWDIVDINGWEKGFHDEPYNKRFEKLQLIKPDNRFDLVQSQIVENLKSASNLFQKLLNNGQEGLILKNYDMPWENKRSYHMVKMKEIKDIDLIITDWVEGTGKYKGMLGALKCENHDGTIKVNVGSGFVDKDRVELTPENTIGKICAVKYNDLIEDKTTHIKSLFLPIFQEIRLDKTKPD
jgi:DNA ligase-1